MSKLVSQLSFIADRSEQIVAEVLEETAQFVLLLIRLYVPVDTGALRDSYEIEIVSPLHIMIGSALFYSIFQEYGTARQGYAQPHVTPAFLNAETFFKKRLAEKIQNARRSF